MDRRRFLKYACATGAVVGASALGLDKCLGLSFRRQDSAESTPTILAEEFNSYIANIANGYPELADELVRIPNFGSVGEDIKAVRSISELASNSLNRSSFEAMLSDGIREKRKYCGSLEALVWLARDLELSQLTTFFASDSSYAFIQRAWRTSSTSRKYSSDRWKNFEEIVDRLSSSRLICAYMADNIKYGGGDDINRGNLYWWRTPAEVFKDKCGYCYEQSAFALHCLVNNGYSTCRILFVRWGPLNTRDTHGLSHAICVEEVEGNYYAINNGKWTGPFDSFDKLKMSASSGNTILGYKFFYYDSIPYHTSFQAIYDSLV